MAIVSTYKVNWRDKSYKDPAERTSYVVAKQGASGADVLSKIRTETGKKDIEFAGMETIVPEVIDVP